MTTDSSSQPLPTLRSASRWRRFFNWLIDSFIGMVALSFLVGIAAFLLLGDKAEAFFENVPDIVLNIVVALIYYIVLEGLFGRTLGKVITGTRGVNETGGRPSFGQVLGRTFCRFIPFEPLSFFFEDARGGHDSIPKTYVIRNDDLPANQALQPTLGREMHPSSADRGPIVENFHKENAPWLTTGRSSLRT